MTKLYLGALAALLLTGCPGRHARPDDFQADPAVFLSRIEARAAAVKSLTAELSLEVWRGDERVRLKQLVALRRPDKLRVDSLSPFGQPLSTLTSDGETLAIYAQDEHRFYTGAATPENLARLVPIRVEPDELVALLRGGVPLGAAERGTVGWDAERGLYPLDLVGPATRRRIHFDPEHLRVRAVRVWRGERLRYEARFTDYTGEGDAALPRRMRFESAEDEVRVDVSVADHRVNVELPDEAFQLEAPRGVPVDSLDR